MVDQYMIYYNTARRHSSIGDDYPQDWYQSQKIRAQRGSQNSKLFTQRCLSFPQLLV